MGCGCYVGFELWWWFGWWYVVVGCIVGGWLGLYGWCDGYLLGYDVLGVVVDVG